MPIITRKRTIRSRIAEVLTAPFFVLFGLLLLGLPVLALTLLIGIPVFLLSGEPWSSLWPTPHDWWIVGMTVAFFSTISIILSGMEVLTSRKFARLWVPDPRCVTASRSFAESLIREDFSNAGAFLAPAAQQPESMTELQTIYRFLAADAYFTLDIGDVIEVPLIPDGETDEEDSFNCLESGEPVHAQCIVPIRCAPRLGDGAPRQQTLHLFWTQCDDELRIVSFGLSPAVE
jgi:hypothetical protein